MAESVIICSLSSFIFLQLYALPAPYIKHKHQDLIKSIPYDTNTNSYPSKRIRQGKILSNITQGISDTESNDEETDNTDSNEMMKPIAAYNQPDEDVIVQQSSDLGPRLPRYVESKRKDSKPSKNDRYKKIYKNRDDESQDDSVELDDEFLDIDSKYSNESENNLTDDVDDESQDDFESQEDGKSQSDFDSADIQIKQEAVESEPEFDSKDIKMNYGLENQQDLESKQDENDDKRINNDDSNEESEENLIGLPLNEKPPPKSELQVDDIEPGYETMEEENLNDDSDEVFQPQEKHMKKVNSKDDEYKTGPNSESEEDSDYSDRETKSEGSESSDEESPELSDEVNSDKANYIPVYKETSKKKRKLGQQHGSHADDYSNDIEGKYNQIYNTKRAKNLYQSKRSSPMLSKNKDKYKIESFSSESSEEND